MIPTDIPAFVLGRPWLVVALTVAILAVVAWQRTLTYSEYRTAHVFKGLLFRVLDPWARQHGRPLVRYKQPPAESDEYVTTVNQPAHVVFHRLRSAGFEPHLLATFKTQRTADGRDTRAHSQLVWFHDNGDQTETYLFAHRGTTDVYGHVEASVVSPEAHLSAPQTPGDARNVITPAVDGPTTEAADG